MSIERTGAVSGYKSHKEIDFESKQTLSALLADFRIYILFLLFLIQSVVSYFTFSYKRLLFSASQRYDIETNIGSITLILQYILQIILLVITKDYYLFVTVLIFTTLANNILCQVTTKKMYPEYVAKGKLLKEEISLLKKTVKGVIAAKIGATAFSSVSNIVISSIFGLIILGKYSNYSYIITTIVALFAVIHNSLRPTLGNYIITETKESNYNILENISILYNWISAACCCCMLSMSQEFIYLWIGSKYLFSFLLIASLSVMFFLGRICCVPSLFTEAAGLWYEGKYIYIIAAAVNLILNIVLAKTIGLIGIPIATIFASVFVTAGGYIYILFKYYFKDKAKLRLYMRNISVSIIQQVITIYFVFEISSLIKADNFFILLLKGILIIVLVSACFFLFGLTNKERFKENLKFLKAIVVK